MAGAPINTQPYGQPQQPIPQFAPPVPRQKGSTAPKVWGIVLLILGSIGLLMLVLTVAGLFGTGMNPSAFAFGVSEEGKREMDRVIAEMATESRGRWTAWANIGAEAAIAGLSLVAGYFLVVRPRPRGRKLAMARALVVLMALPMYGYESTIEAERSEEMTIKMNQIQVDEAVKKEVAKNPKMTPEEQQRKRQEIADAVAIMEPFIGVAGYATVLLTVIGIIGINGLLLFQMTRPAVRDYMEHAGKHGPEPIPNYDPSMGLMAGPPPGSPQPSAMTQPPVPPEQPPV